MHTKLTQLYLLPIVYFARFLILFNLLLVGVEEKRDHYIFIVESVFSDGCVTD